MERGNYKRFNTGGGEVITVSENFNPYSTVRDVDMIVTFNAESSNASKVATFTSDDKESISKLNQLIVKEYDDIKYATCENGLVKLDGSWKFLPDTLTNEHIGWWSESISDENGEFITPPKITITLSNKDSCVGFMLYSSNGSYIKECLITTYNDQKKIYKEVFNSDNSILIADLPVKDFNKIEIEITKTDRPHRRVKLLQFIFGIIKTWNRNNIVSASIDEEVDVMGETLPISELKVEFDNSTGEFDLFGETKEYAYQYEPSRATISSWYSNEISKASQTRNSIVSEYKYATCENGLIKLDGSWRFLPDTLTDEHIGYVNNELSDENSEFENIPGIEYWFIDYSTKTMSYLDISTVRLYFASNNYACSIKITTYQDSLVISEETYQNESPIADIDIFVTNCNRITFEFISVNAKNRFLKLTEIEFLHYADSWGNYLTENQKLSTQIIINGESIPMGNIYSFYSLEQSKDELTATITAKDLITLLDSRTYTNGSQGTSTLSTVLNDIITDTNIDIEYIPQSLKNTIVSKTTPKDTTKRAATHYFVQASKATCYLNRQGKLKVRSLDVSTPVDTIDYNCIYEKNIANMSSYVDNIKLVVTDEYAESTEGGDNSVIYYGGTGRHYREINNNCVYSANGTSVAEWLLKQASRRVYFEIEYRGNPAIELGDTIRIITSSRTYLAVVYSQSFEYDGGLKVTLKAIV